MKNFIKSIIIAILSFSSILFVEAQNVHYIYKPLALEGCQVNYSVSKTDTMCYIVASVESDRMMFMENPTMKIKTFKDEVITLDGFVSSNLTTTTGVVVGNVIYPSPDVISTAFFAATPEQFELLSHGVAKIRLTMSPMNHERDFKKDKIGKKLYQFFLKKSADNF